MSLNFANLFFFQLLNENNVNWVKCQGILRICVFTNFLLNFFFSKKTMEEHSWQNSPDNTQKLEKNGQNNEKKKTRENKPVSWIHSASGDKFPIKMDLNHPLWQTFLESGSVSPTQFFRMFFRPPTYFHNPTPWQSRSSAR